VKRKFSERYGYAKQKDIFQINSMDAKLQNRIWNQIKRFFLDEISICVQGYVELKSDREFILELYDNYYGAQINAVGIYDKYNRISFDKFNKDFERRFFTGNREKNWYKIYDLIEVLHSINNKEKVAKSFYVNINKVLEEEMSAYRLIDKYITPIIEDIEIKEIEEALEIEYNGAKRHLSNALELLSDREKPDYPNSIKESITAVEAVAKEITGKDTDIANCLKLMDLDLNKQFKTAMTNMYGWTNKEDGIRHGHTGVELKTSFEEAKYMLVTCSAFVNYMIAKKGQK